MTQKGQIVLMSKERINRSLKRIAYQLAEANRRNVPLLLAGINERGYAVAEMLSSYLEEIVDCEVFLRQLHPESNRPKEIEQVPYEDYLIVLVDDVIFSGRTMFSALLQLSDLVPLQEVHTVSLIDRGHRNLPIKAEFAGMRLSTKLNEHVSAQLGENKKIEKVLLYNK